MKLFLSILIGLFLFGCTLQSSITEEKIQKGWRLSEVVAVNGKDAKTAALIKELLQKTLISTGSVMHFFPDKTYTDLTNYSIKDGKWELVNGNELKFGENKISIQKLEVINSRTFMIGDLYLAGQNLNVTLKWVEEVPMLENFKEDPFYADNNKWRQKPEDKENEEQIKQRLLNYVLHFAYILKAASERKQNAVSFAHSLGIIQVYRGGVGAVSMEHIDDNWINCFYDSEDAKKAYDLFSLQLVNSSYNGGTTGEWIKDDYNILMSIVEDIKDGMN